MGTEKLTNAVLPGVLVHPGNRKVKRGCMEGGWQFTLQSQGSILFCGQMYSLCSQCSSLCWFLLRYHPERSWLDSTVLPAITYAPAHPLHPPHTLSADLQNPAGTSTYLSHCVLPSFRGLYSAAISQGKGQNLTGPAPLWLYLKQPPWPSWLIQPHHRPAPNLPHCSPGGVSVPDTDLFT